MKKIILSTVLFLLLVISLAGCGKKELPLSTTPASRVALQHMGFDLTITDQKEVEQLTNAVASLQTKETEPSQSDIQTPIYTFTLYNNDSPTDSIVLFSSSLLQSNDVYFSGDFNNLFDC
ncbi:MAG: hypothetical protein IKU10_05830, partial [Clostridia bacterium]|nr:hypothetical protein [Clostridia bacterium]